PNEAAEFLPELLAAAGDEKANVRRAVAIALGGPIGQDAPQCLRVLTELVGDLDLHVCLAAVHSLRQLGPGAAPAAPALREALKEKGEKVRQAISQAIVKIDPDPKSLASLLRAALTAPEYRHDAANVTNALGQLGRAAAPAVPELAALLKDKKLNAPEFFQV